MNRNLLVFVVKHVVALAYSRFLRPTPLEKEFSYVNKT